ncbi:SpoIIE family protein phosphatase [Streptomyces gamaensis]|uniref:SpoIIE family protein phosphatase n=1 Tax=Streptomyces gamaensis TaxID=1763542 RepID=A0ABW0ZBL7_9ACTN
MTESTGPPGSPGRTRKQASGPARTQGSGPARTQGSGPARTQGSGPTRTQGSGPTRNKASGPTRKKGSGPTRKAPRPPGRFARTLPATLIATGTAFDLATPAHYTPAPFLSAAPLVAAPLYSLRGTVLTALASVAAALALTFFNPSGDTGASLSENLTIVTVALIAIGINRLVHRTGERLASARGIAEAAQRAVLPAPPARIGGLRVAARYVAALADARIGGDLYAVQDTPYGVRVLVGDVRGKGLEAVEAVAVVIGAFREAAEQERTLEALACRLERALEREGARRANLDQVEGFTTAVLAEIPPGAAALRLVNRGHPPPLLLHPDGTVGEVEPAVPALPLGMGELGEWPDRAEEWEFPPGSTLLLFTDGVTEARDERGAFYDPQVRLAGRQFRNPETLLDALVTDVGRHAGGQTADDMALLAIRRHA